MIWHFFIFLAILISTLQALPAGTPSTATDAQPSTTYPTPTPKSTPARRSPYKTGYPLCNIAGYPGVDNTKTEYNHLLYTMNRTLSDCMEECRWASFCNSVAWEPRRRYCFFFREVVQHTRLIADRESKYLFYDAVCGEEMLVEGSGKSLGLAEEMEEEGMWLLGWVWVGWSWVGGLGVYRCLECYSHFENH